MFNNFISKLKVFCRLLLVLFFLEVFSPLKSISETKQSSALIPDISIKQMNQVFEPEKIFKRIQEDKLKTTAFIDEINAMQWGIESDSTKDKINDLLQQSLTLLKNQELALEKYLRAATSTLVDVDNVNIINADLKEVGFQIYEDALTEFLTAQEKEITLEENEMEALLELENLEKLYLEKEQERRKITESLLQIDTSPNLQLVKAEAIYDKSLYQLQEIQYRTLRKEFDQQQDKVRLLRIDADQKARSTLLPEMIFKETIESLKLYQIELQKNLSALQDQYSSISAVSARDALSQRIQLITRQIQRTSLVIDNWHKRKAIFDDVVSQHEKRSWLEYVNKNISLLESSKQNAEKAVSSVQSELITLESKDNIADSKELNERKQTLELLLEAYNEEVSNINAARILALRLKQGIEAKLDMTSIGDYFFDFGESIKALWSYEIFTTSDDKPITVKKITWGILLILLGVFFSRKISVSLGQKLLPRFGVNKGTSAALESLLFYLLIIVCSLSALRIVNVPLTVFAFLGGAAAIGIGFGSQTVMSNFISGLIMLIEQPIRPGDLIEIGGYKGQVKRIGTRSTTVLTKTHIDLVVPNSEILHKSMVNWTLASRKVKQHVNVGVSYSSDINTVKELLLEAAHNHENILKTPAPMILLKNFGDSALELELNFYVDLHSFTQLDQTLSDLRVDVLNRFREKGIKIPLPKYEVRVLGEK